MYTSIVTGTNSIYERSYINDGKNDQRMRQSWIPKGKKESSNSVGFLRADASKV